MEWQEGAEEQNPLTPLIVYAERSSWIKMPPSLCNSSYPYWNHWGNGMLDVWGLQNRCPIISLFCFVIIHVTFNCFHTLFTWWRKYHAEWFNCDFNTKPTNKKSTGTKATIQAMTFRSVRSKSNCTQSRVQLSVTAKTHLLFSTKWSWKRS